MFIDYPSLSSTFRLVSLCVICSIEKYVLFSKFSPPGCSELNKGRVRGVDAAGKLAGTIKSARTQSVTDPSGSQRTVSAAKLVAAASESSAATRGWCLPLFAIAETRCREQERGKAAVEREWPSDGRALPREWRRVGTYCQPRILYTGAGGEHGYINIRVNAESGFSRCVRADSDDTRKIPGRNRRRCALLISRADSPRRWTPRMI